MFGSERHFSLEKVNKYFVFLQSLINRDHFPWLIPSVMLLKYFQVENLVTLWSPLVKTIAFVVYSAPSLLRSSSFSDVIRIRDTYKGFPTPFTLLNSRYKPSCVFVQLSQTFCQNFTCSEHVEDCKMHHALLFFQNYTSQLTTTQ